MFVITSQNSKTPVLESAFNKGLLQAFNLLKRDFIKKKLQHKCFPATFAKVLKILFKQNISGRMLLHIVFCKFFILKLLKFFSSRKQILENYNRLVHNVFHNSRYFFLFFISLVLSYRVSLKPY